MHYVIDGRTKTIRPTTPEEVEERHRLESSQRRIVPAGSSEIQRYQKLGFRMENPRMGFRKLAAELARKGAEDPRALAAWIGRRKYGAERFQKMAAAGRRRKAKINPSLSLPRRHPSIGAVNEAIDLSLRRNGLRLVHFIDQAVPFGQSRQFLLATSDPSVIVAVQLKRLPDGTYEIMQYRRVSNPAAPHVRLAAKLSRDLAAIRGHSAYMDTLGDVNRTLEQALSKHGLSLLEWFDRHLDREQSESRLLATSDPSVLIHAQVYRMPSGRYELTAYATSQKKRNPEWLARLAGWRKEESINESFRELPKNFSGLAAISSAVDRALREYGLRLAEQPSGKLEKGESFSGVLKTTDPSFVVSISIVRDYDGRYRLAAAYLRRVH